MLDYRVLRARASRSYLARPAQLAIRLFDCEVVDARVAALHQTAVSKLPHLVAVRAEPVARIVVPFVFEAHTDAIVHEAPQLLLEPVLELLRPLALQECLDRVTAGEELCAVAPLGVGCVRKRNALRVARIPRVLGGLDFLTCGVQREGRQRRFRFHIDAPHRRLDRALSYPAGERFSHRAWTITVRPSRRLATLLIDLFRAFSPINRCKPSGERDAC